MTVPCDPALEWLSVLRQWSGSQLQLQGSLAGLVEAEPKRMARLGSPVPWRKARSFAQLYRAPLSTPPHFYHFE